MFFCLGQISFVCFMFLFLKHFCPVTCQEGCAVKNPQKRKRAMMDLAALLIGGSRGGREGRTPPPGRPNSFDFMQFSGKFGVFTPPLEGSRPPRENPGSATAAGEEIAVCTR